MGLRRLYGEPNDEALEILMRNFDIADVTDRDTPEALRYNLTRIEVAEHAIKAIEDPKKRRQYSDWLYFFRTKAEAKLASGDAH